VFVLVARTYSSSETDVTISNVNCLFLVIFTETVNIANILDIIVLRFFKHSGSRIQSFSVIRCKRRRAHTHLSPLKGARLSSRAGPLNLMMNEDQF
jgi:hypothetical protein